MDTSNISEMMNAANVMEMMKDNYLYIIGGLVILGAFAYFYYLRMNKSVSHFVSQHNNEAPNVECDGDKCFIKQGQPKYDKCDDN